MEQARTHPIFIAAGVAVLLFSLLGAAALTGVLPSAGSTNGTGATSAASTSSTSSTSRSGTKSAKPAGKPCATCGVVESVRAIEAKGESTGIGAVAGGIAGGVVGNQFGHRGTRTLLTVGGAAGGAFAGDAIEKNLKKQTTWRVAVRMNDGTLRTLSHKAQPPFSVGDRVRIVDGAGVERA